VKRSTVVFLVISLVIAAGCVRLGVWQLARLGQRRAMNARIAPRMTAAPVSAAVVDRDTAKNRFSMVVVSGTPDYDHEVLLTYRGHDGAPGVDLLTPMRLPGQDTAIFVNRGWVYSPDGSTIDPRRWRESTTVFTGYLDAFASETSDSVRNGRIRRASYEAIARAVPYPIQRYYLVALGDTATQGDSSSALVKIVRLGRPKLDEGPHLSYAFQWFGFATIAVIGAVVVAARSMR
jgi:surfeit locus 1 family protein